MRWILKMLGFARPDSPLAGKSSVFDLDFKDFEEWSGRDQEMYSIGLAHGMAMWVAALADAASPESDRDAWNQVIEQIDPGRLKIGVWHYFRRRGFRAGEPSFGDTLEMRTKDRLARGEPLIPLLFEAAFNVVRNMAREKGAPLRTDNG